MRSPGPAVRWGFGCRWQPGRRFRAGSAPQVQPGPRARRPRGPVRPLCCLRSSRAVRGRPGPAVRDCSALPRRPSARLWSHQARHGRLRLVSGSGRLLRPSWRPVRAVSSRYTRTCQRPWPPTRRPSGFSLPPWDDPYSDLRVSQVAAVMGRRALSPAGNLSRAAPERSPLGPWRRPPGAATVDGVPTGGGAKPWPTANGRRSGSGAGGATR